VFVDRDENKHKSAKHDRAVCTTKSREIALDKIFDVSIITVNLVVSNKTMDIVLLDLRARKSLYPPVGKVG